MNADDLFAWGASRPAYPVAPGHRRTATSEAAAPSIADAVLMRGRVLDAFREHGPMTADECAACLGLSVLSVRPRCTELKRAGKLTETGERRKTAFAKLSSVLTA